MGKVIKRALVYALISFGLLMTSGFLDTAHAATVKKKRAVILREVQGELSGKNYAHAR